MNNLEEAADAILTEGKVRMYSKSSLSEEVHFRPFWWVYSGVNRMSKKALLTKSDIYRMVFTASLGTNYSIFKKKYNSMNAKIGLLINNTIVTLAHIVDLCAGLYTLNTQGDVRKIIYNYRDKDIELFNILNKNFE
jgi:hypothetical protein